jgi:hypothetical protein
MWTITEAGLYQPTTPTDAATIVPTNDLTGEETIQSMPVIFHEIC